MKKKLSMQVQESASIEERFQQFLSASAARGLSDKTLKTYREHLRCISKHLDITAPLSSLTKSDTESMITSMRASGLATNSISNNIITLTQTRCICYLDSLDAELSNQPGFKKPPTRIARKRCTTSQTDPDCGYINHGSKRGIGYLMEATVDCKHGILTGVDVYPANEKESLLVLRHLERQINIGVPMNRLALDRGYETGAVHRGLELLGIIGYIPAIQFSNPPEKYGFSYDSQRDAFICPEGVPLAYHGLNYNQSTGKYLRCYQVEGNACMHCPKRPSCFDKAGARRRVLATSCYPAFFRGH